jgi:Xaa-Pro aminopeptidase
MMAASMTHDHGGRLARAGAETQAAGLDALLIAPSADLVYLVGYDAPLLERLTVLVARPGGDPIMVVPELERPRAAASPAGGLVQLEGWRDGQDAYQLVRRLVPGGGAFGVSDRLWASHLIELQKALPQASFAPASGVLSTLRMRKDDGEIALLGRAARSADEAFNRLKREGFSGRPEEDVSRRLAALLVECGCESAAFSIVASGPNAASPHHEPGSRGIRQGDALVLDFGGRVGGYCSDITRTVSVGETAGELMEVHQIVHAAQDAAFAAIRPGVRAQAIDRAARRVIEEAGYGDAFIHRTGHGIGLEEHEAPYIVEGNDIALEPGMSFSIEPGIYLSGRFGVRIEDIVAVTEDGAVRLNHAPRELVSVG